MKPKLYLINGPLGAGKTTLLRELLKQPQFQSARVIENEFASTSVDTDQLHDHQAEVKTIAGLCICCSTGDELIEALLSLADSPEPVIIEATGVANSLMLIEKLIVGNILDKYELAHGIFVLDAVEAVAHPDSLEVYHDELQAADTLLVSKTDLLAPEDYVILLERLEAIRTLPVAPVTEGVCDLALLDRPSQVLDYYVEHDGEIKSHDSAVNYTVLRLPGPVSPAAIEQSWPMLSAEFGLRRMKGDIADGDGDWWHIEATPAQCRVHPADTAKNSQLVCIGEAATTLTAEAFMAEVTRG